jgi:hypothetical protein
MGVIGLDRDLPALPGTGVHAHRLKRDGQQPAGHLFARGNDRVIFAGIVEGGVGTGDLRHGCTQFDKFVGLAGHRRDHHGNLVPGVDLAFDVPGDIADPVEVGNRGAAKFHHYAGHDYLSADEPV